MADPALKVYLASAYQTRPRMSLYALELADAGMVCTASWVEETHPVTADLSEKEVSQHVGTDLRDIRGSDALVIFTKSATGQLGGGGRHVEMGVALERGIPIFVVGEPENVFQRAVGKVCPDWHRALIELIALERRLERERPRAERA